MEENIIKCSQCLKEIEEGFLCLERNKVLCNDCQANFNMSKCPHDKSGQHMHIKFPGTENQNEKYLKTAREITEKIIEKEEAIADSIKKDPEVWGYKMEE